MKQKICPSCGKACKENSMFCDGCGEIILKVEAIEVESMAQKSVPHPIEEPLENTANMRVYYRGLHTSNADYGKVGESAKESDTEEAAHGEITVAEGKNDISSDSDSSEGKPLSEFILRSIDGRYSFAVHVGKSNIGRGSEMGEFLQAKKFVSRRHASLIAENGNLYITDNQSTNGTYVNGKIIRPLCKILLSEYDRVSLGGKESDVGSQNSCAHFSVIKKS